MFKLSTILITIFCSFSYAKNINIQTSNPSLKKELYQLVEFSLKETDEKQLLPLVTKYLVQNHYLQSSISINTSKKSINIKVENPIQYFFVFRGNKKVDTLLLYSLIKDNNFFSTPYITEEVKKIIQKYYKENAFHGVQIQTSLKKKNHQVYVRLTIKEGKEFVIQKINFSGSLSKKTSFYKNLFKEHKNSVFNLKYYEENKVDLYLQSMVRYLRKMGYAKTLLYHKAAAFDGNRVTLNVILKEGPATRIQKIIVKGNRHIPSKKIKSILKMKKGDLLNIEDIQNDIQKVVQLYKDEHFLKIAIDQKNLVRIHPSFKTAQIHINIKERNIAYLKKLHIEGNKDIDTDYIRFISNFKIGQKITQYDIDQATYFLEDTGLFSIVDISFTSKQKNSITIKVQEGSFGFYRIKGGVNTKNQLSLQANFDIDKKNLWGRNRSYFLINSEIGTSIQLLRNISGVKDADLFSEELPLFNVVPYSLSTSYTHSYFWKSNFDAKFTYTHKNEIYSLSPSRADWIRSHQLGFNLSRKLDSTSHAIWRLWNIELNESYTQDFSNQSVKTSLQEGQIVADMGFDVRVDRRDNLLFPTEGFYFDFKTDYSSPYIGAHDNIHFVSTEIKFRYYISLWNTVFAQAINGGFIQNISENEIPVRRYFILGGLNSLRGFDGEIQGDRIPRINEFSIDNPLETRKDSSYYFLLKQEFRFPIYRDFLNGALFYDAGGVYLTSKDLFSFGHSFGFGIHSMTGLGPLVINLGFKIKPQPQESAFHLSWAMGAF